MQIHRRDHTGTLADLTVTELGGLLSTRKCSPEEIVKDCLARIETLDPSVRAFVDMQRACSITSPVAGITLMLLLRRDARARLCRMGAGGTIDHIGRQQGF
jgi:Asp-tRNA(Asn)/Glu-tRNA(Gln) amidotransferase A subunit family amidase